MIIENSMIHGDYNDHLPLIPDKSIDMINCDLPYNITACKWDVEIDLDELWTHYKRIIKDNGAIVLSASQPFTSKLVMSNLKWFKYEWIWLKTRGTNYLQASLQPLKQHESILVFSVSQTNYNPQKSKGIPYFKIQRTNNKDESTYRKDTRKNGFITENMGSRNPISYLYYENPNNNLLHPNEKPVALYEYLIKTYTNEGDLVLDNCAGSMTTAIACINTRRDYICIEKEKEYYDKGIERIKEHTRQLRLAI
jgi:site-specific DNA-methyltransferase (adenine-specific)